MCGKQGKGLRRPENAGGQPSVAANPQPGAPYGPDLKTPWKMRWPSPPHGSGRKTATGNIGYADLPGKSTTQIATITHLDVVPEGNGWTGSPLKWWPDGYVVGAACWMIKAPPY